MSKEITVMIVEDDEVAAKIYEQFTHKMDGYRVIASASSGKQALELLEVFTPDLILLDVFLPDMNGIDLLWEIRKNQREIDVILVTAANDADTVSEAIRGGAFSYIIKPIMIDKFLSTLEQYSFTRQQLTHTKFMDQHEVDLYFHPQQKSVANQEETTVKCLPKGIDKHTLKIIREKLQHETGSVNADELSQIVGVSHCTVRRYLEFLVSDNELEVEVLYGTVGRPERRYKLCQPVK
ncbi:response regulator [Brevibacillus ginsengisoli]|uniref:response regulator n=1 Tax=Brevibacillus ginsengisoli TaxID=363854 RepID=UPI003CFB1C85